jgi:hypothetical protein
MRFMAEEKISKLNSNKRNLKGGKMLEEVIGIRAKFRCEEKSETDAATPSGQIELQVVNPEAAKRFEVGKTYYVDFSPAE